ncbi:type II toxin-antitoxin system prevent-host-death family antitoxin [Chromatiaceae bacterium AAb-1]|nr:type II toxin-antitoxin system prevent-host-death family antitoxin [Chromatiaceae bacterium AAb-1]
MPVTTVTSREFNHDAAAAKRAAKRGPVHITNRGQLEAVLLSADEYKKLIGKTKKITELLACPAVADIELNITRPKDLPREIGNSRNPLIQLK